MVSYLKCIGPCGTLSGGQGMPNTLRAGQLYAQNCESENGAENEPSLLYRRLLLRWLQLRKGGAACPAQTRVRDIHAAMSDDKER